MQEKLVLAFLAWYRVVVSIDQTAFFMQLNSIWVTHIPLIYSQPAVFIHFPFPLSRALYYILEILYTSTCSMGSTKHAEKSSVTLLKKKFSYLYIISSHHIVCQLQIYMLLNLFIFHYLLNNSDKEFGKCHLFPLIGSFFFDVYVLIIMHPPPTALLLCAIESASSIAIAPSPSQTMPRSQEGLPQVPNLPARSIHRWRRAHGDTCRRQRRSDD